ncbi:MULTISPECIES: S9 family peptidase [unclassified Okeania]|uniref:S9 family peptidase n=1 Tax=unclassified Okeania TaxID=2634635 RepID=UPI0013BC9B9D|nr:MULTISPECIES: S9 family peptidase [unclassified Okeania]NET16316.1 S9 family peptidase [Okeania sp. SIO1H6]NES78707.1 S9 family peptidase [Okeania sp. SIO1H4]NET22938.1 S9 family peptidase [Okeania sp. SIO1H5]NET80251.1 S9 family peptidase [Okeania sp. SIO1F9]NET96357.1 S9 family peptidase [Okeania sp. SIO1H2]
MKEIAPYGSWKSPITADLIVAGTIGLSSLAIDGEDVYWIEGRPSEGGRNVIVRHTPDGQTTDITPPPFNVRTRVHEYGGGAFLVTDGRIYFSNFADQRLYCQTPDAAPQPLTPEANCRYADAVMDKQRDRLICIQEDHTQGGEPINRIVSINIKNKADIQILVEGNDFYASPRLSPDGKRLCWISWNHPNMPWDGTELWVAKINANGLLGEAQLVAGGKQESIFQPEWSPEGILYFVSDRSKWWNIYRVSGTEMVNVEPLYPLNAEFGMPQWVFGMSTYGFTAANKIICTFTQNGTWHLATLNATKKHLQQIEIPYTSMGSLKVKGERVYFLGSSPTKPTEIVNINLSTGAINILKRSTDLEINSGYLSIPQSIEFPTENGNTAYGLFYPPTNQDYTEITSEKPPLLVKSHGGPTAATSSSLSLKIQYWTSRGFALLDVNYGGSTGYGREYQQRLKDNWGIVDVDDCVNGAQYLAKRGLVDSNRMAISGGSAGGYTTLCALTFKDVFKAGASYYGVSNLEALATDTHKFESRYLDGLIGPYPEKKDLYKQRSPINFTELLSCPVIFFQGLEDKIVPPNQAEIMLEALKQKGLPVAYVAFPEEQHGFRRSENIKRALDGEFYFYSRVFGFTPADNLEEVEIINL